MQSRVEEPEKASGDTPQRMDAVGLEDADDWLRGSEEIEIQELAEWLGVEEESGEDPL